MLATISIPASPRLTGGSTRHMAGDGGLTSHSDVRAVLKLNEFYPPSTYASATATSPRKRGEENHGVRIS